MMGKIKYKVRAIGKNCPMQFLKQKYLHAQWPFQGSLIDYFLQREQVYTMTNVTSPLQRFVAMVE